MAALDIDDTVPNAPCAPSSAIKKILDLCIETVTDSMNKLNIVRTWLDSVKGLVTQFNNNVRPPASHTNNAAFIMEVAINSNRWDQITTSMLANINRLMIIRDFCIAFQSKCEPDAIEFVLMHVCAHVDVQSVILNAGTHSPRQSQFVHTLTRSIKPFVRLIDQLGELDYDRLDEILLMLDVAINNIPRISSYMREIKTSNQLEFELQETTKNVALIAFGGVDEFVSAIYRHHRTDRLDSAFVNDDSESEIEPDDL